jgi:divalent metal cation (Fe/Co/Zn/Cd) transporter
MSTYIENYGVTKSYIQNNNKESINEIKWKGNYNGEQANIELLINDDGNKQHMKMKLNNDELMELLSIQPVEKSLEQRLLTDFIPGEDIYLYSKPFRKKTRKHKKRTHKSKSKSRSKK